MRAVCGGSLVLGFLLLTGALRADAQADAKAVIDKALKAMGAADKVVKFQTGTCQCKITGDDNGKQLMIVGEATWQGTDKFCLHADVTDNGKNFKGRIVINGAKGWHKEDQNVHAAPEEMVLSLKEAFHALQMPYLLPRLKGKAYTLSPLGEVKVNDKPAVGITVSHKDHKDLSVHFDKMTGLPVKSETRIAPEGKEFAVEYFYSDFKEVDGVKHPMKVTIKADGNKLTVEISEITAKDKVEDSLFAKP